MLEPPIIEALSLFASQQRDLKDLCWRCAALMQAEVPHGSHRLVALARLETFVRFARVLQQDPAAIPRVLTVFLGPLGIGHPAKVCTLF